MTTRPCQALLLPATTTFLTVPLDSLLMDAIASLIVQRRTVDQRARTLVGSMATYTAVHSTDLPAATYIHGEHTTVCTTPSIVLRKYRRCILFNLL